MADYRIILSRSAIKEFENLQAMSSSAFARKSVPDYRVRVGDYRILFTIADDEKVVDISTISHRSDVYE